jgi:D-serine deaminase-like pyridoxal phosphate-dependent protein
LSFVPFGYRTLFLVPFRAEGVTDSGISIAHHEKLHVIYGRVTATHSTCRNARVGDWAVFLPNRPTRVPTARGNIYVLDERQILGIVEPGDGAPWFAPAA